MNITPTAGNIGPGRPEAHEALPLHAWLAAAKRMLRSVASVPEATPAEVMAREAAKVRALAYSYRLTDPGFASDLYAAADRHERDIEVSALKGR